MNHKNTQQTQSWLLRCICWLGQFQFIVGAVFGIALTIISAVFWTREQARQAVMDPVFVAQLSKSIRPFMIVDSHRTIVSDYGVTDLLKDIKFEISSNETEMKITLSFKQHIVNPPLVRPMNGGFYFHSAERGELHDWIVRMRISSEVVVLDKPSTMTMQLSSLEQDKRYMFLVEVLH